MGPLFLEPIILGAILGKDTKYYHLFLLKNMLLLLDYKSMIQRLAAIFVLL